MDTGGGVVGLRSAHGGIYCAWISVVAYHGGGCANSSGGIANCRIAWVAGTIFEGERAISSNTSIIGTRVVIVANNWGGYARAVGCKANSRSAKICRRAREIGESAGGVRTNGHAVVICARVVIIAYNGDLGTSNSRVTCE